MKDHYTRKPPGLPNKLLRWYCRNANIEDLEGDLEELFLLNLEHMPARRAKMRYWKDVASLIFSYALKRRREQAAFHVFSSTFFHPAMLKNYFVIATRSLARHKFFAAVNTIGLAVGMSISLLLIAMLSFLWRYDDFHSRQDNIYRIISTKHDGSRNEKFASAPSLLADKLKDEYAGIDQAIRINANLAGEADYEGMRLPLNGYFVDASFLDVFTFPLLKGNARSALTKPNALLITETASKKMFGQGDALGKIISMPPFGDFEITGVLKDHPKNTHFHFEVLASYQTLLSLQREGKWKVENPWKEFRNSYVYLLLQDGIEPERLENFLADVSGETYGSEDDLKVSFRLQALNDITPGEDLYNQIGPSWDYISLSIFACLTLMILLPACFNYANISISRALKRMKEIGLRKVMGGQRNQIFIQFITETVVIAFIALVIAAGMFHFIREQFLMLIVGSDALELNVDVRTASYFVLFALFVGLTSGLVPALYLSKLTPIYALKAKNTARGFTSLNFRKFLVVSQFALSLGFIMGVVVVLNQYRYTVSHDMGFNKENILDVELQQTNPEIFRNEFSRLSSVQKISMSSGVLGTTISGRVMVKTPEKSDSAEVFQMFVDHQFIPNLGIDLVAGENFSPDSRSNQRFVIVNEEFLKAFRITDPRAAAGQTFLLGNSQEVTVIGVVRNFHYMDLSEPVKSFFFRCDPAEFRFANIKVGSANIFSSISEMESTWKTLAPNQRFTARFFEDEIEETYSFYFSMVKICGFLGFLAITISCLGLLGMVVFTVENRVKEIGIRKVMGASEINVIYLLSKHFANLMLVAALIAVPVTWMFFEKVYLRVYFYRINIGFTEPRLSLLFMMFIGLATILSQTMRAAKANPVDSLRSE